MHTLDKLVNHLFQLLTFTMLIEPGFYILTDNNEPTTLPTGNYDIPLMIAAKQFQSNGKLFSPEAERDSLWGGRFRIMIIDAMVLR
jgi:hypothetical protein